MELEADFISLEDDDYICVHAAGMIALGPRVPAILFRRLLCYDGRVMVLCEWCSLQQAALGMLPHSSVVGTWHGWN